MKFFFSCKQNLNVNRRIYCAVIVFAFYLHSAAAISQSQPKRRFDSCTYAGAPAAAVHGPAPVLAASSSDGPVANFGGRLRLAGRDLEQLREVLGDPHFENAEQFLEYWHPSRIPGYQAAGRAGLFAIRVARQIRENRENPGEVERVFS